MFIFFESPPEDSGHRTHRKKLFYKLYAPDFLGCVYFSFGYNHSLVFQNTIIMYVSHSLFFPAIENFQKNTGPFAGYLITG